MIRLLINTGDAPEAIQAGIDAALAALARHGIAPRDLLATATVAAAAPTDAEGDAEGESEPMTKHPLIEAWKAAANSKKATVHKAEALRAGWTGKRQDMPESMRLDIFAARLANMNPPMNAETIASLRAASFAPVASGQAATAAAAAEIASEEPSEIEDDDLTGMF